MQLLVRLLGLLFLVVGTVGFALMLAGAGSATNVIPIDALTSRPIQPILGVVGALIAIIFPVYLVVGVGLLRYAMWARPLAFAVAMMSVFSFPVGTIIALVTFGVLHRTETKRLFEPQGRPGRRESSPPVTSAVDDATTHPLPPETFSVHADSQKAHRAGATIAYRLEVDDLVAFAEYHSAHSPAVRRSYYYTVAVGAAMTIAILWLVGFRTVGGWAGAIAALIGWVVYLNWRTASGNRRYYEKVYSEEANRHLIRLHRMSADEDGLTVATDAIEGRMQWTAVDRIVETPDFAFVYVGSLNAYTIPRARVVTGDFRTFVDAIRRLHDASRCRA